MDKELIKIAAYIGGGVAVGATIGVLVTRDHFKSKFQDQLEEEILSVKNAFERQQEIDGQVEDTLSAIVVEQTIINPPDTKLVNQYEALIRQQGYVQEGGVFVNGEPYGTGGDPDPDDDGETTTNEQMVMEFLSTDDLPPRVPGKPYVIDLNTYMTTPEIDKVALVYYEEDGVLADDRDQMVDLTHIGGAENFFGRGSGDPQLVYVHNEKLEVFFEVCKEEGSYQKLILKINEPRPRPVRRMPKDD